MERFKALPLLAMLGELADNQLHFNHDKAVQTSALIREKLQPTKIGNVDKPYRPC
ncbi:MAG: hypothetical protein L0I09_03345 [Lactobacillus sp.]|nr:hypothetical protein [Lactobacillus sp.]